MILLYSLLFLLIIYQLIYINKNRSENLLKIFKKDSVNDNFIKKISNYLIFLKIYLSIFFEFCWIHYIKRFFPKNSESIQILSKNSLIVTYQINNKIFKMFIKPKKGPNKIVNIFDQDKNNITQQILPFFGPEQNWHMNNFKPSFWNKEKISFELSSGLIKNFESDQIINLED